MTVRRLLLVLALAAGLSGAAYVGQEAAPAGAKMTAAAEEFVAGLGADQRAKAVFAFDDPERTNWHFVPHQKGGKPLRKGLRLDEMTPGQREAARRLLRAGTSPEGFVTATTIMSLESVLRDLEKGGGPVRDPDWYFFSVFGTPSRAGRWGWRVEGHHLSLNFTLDRGRVASATPAFFGANPALRPGKGEDARTLPEAEDAARALFDALDDGQRRAARQARQFPEIEQGKSKPEVGEPAGLPAAKMDGRQRGLLVKLLEGYAARMPPDVAAAELRAVTEAGLDKVHFAFAREDDKPGRPYTYRVQGPTFAILFLNVQPDSARNPANHVHSVWRSLPDDFSLATH
jgi:hypothetical protein